MGHLKDFFFIGKPPTPKGLLKSLRQTFGSEGLAIRKFDNPFECETRRNAYLGGIIVNLGDSKTGLSVESDTLHGVARLQRKFPNTPVMLQSNAFDPEQTPEAEHYELALRSMTNFDFAVASNPQTHSSEYIAQLLKNAFDRYNDTPLGQTILNQYEKSIYYKGNALKLTPEQLSTFVDFAKKPWQIRSISEIHNDRLQSTGTPASTKKRIYTLRKKLKDAEFPDHIRMHSADRYQFVPTP